jgi:hypothetical protein
MKRQRSACDAITRRELLLVCLIFSVSVAIHLLVLDPAFNGPDAISNFQFARDGQDWSYWLDRDAFLGNQFPMGYGTFLALMTKLTGGNYLPIQLIQIGLGLALAVCGWLLTRHISRLARLATLAAIAFSPAVFWLSQSNGYEILLAFFITAALAILWGCGGVPPDTGTLLRRFGPGLAGLLMGLSMLCQGKTIVLVPILVYLALRWGRLQAAAFLLLATLPLALWGLRNQFVLRTWDPFNSSSGVVIWMGNNGSTETGGYVQYPPPLPPEFTSPIAASVNFVISQPEAAYALFLRRMVRLIEPIYQYPDFGGVRGANIALHVILIGLSILGVLLFALYLFGRVWVSSPVIPLVGPLAAFVMTFVLVHIPFATETRHLKPIIPVALAVAIPTGIALIRRARRTRLGPAQPELRD